MAPGPSAGPEAVGGEAPRYRVAWSALLGGAALLALALALGWFLLRRQPPPPAPPQASYYAQYGYRGYPPAY